MQLWKSYGRPLETTASESTNRVRCHPGGTGGRRSGKSGLFPAAPLAISSGGWDLAGTRRFGGTETSDRRLQSDHAVHLFLQHNPLTEGVMPIHPLRKGHLAAVLHAATAHGT